MTSICAVLAPSPAGGGNRSIAAAMCVMMAAAPAFAQDRADIDRTQIIGNRELPKVTYIVPWKKPVPGELSGRPTVSVLDEALAPVDRDVFRRQVSYDGQVRATASVSPPPQPSPSGGGSQSASIRPSK